MLKTIPAKKNISTTDPRSIYLHINFHYKSPYRIKGAIHRLAHGTFLVHFYHRRRGVSRTLISGTRLIISLSCITFSLSPALILTDNGCASSSLSLSLSLPLSPSLSKAIGPR